MTGRLIDADRLLQGHEDHDFIDTHIIWNTPTVEAIPVEWIQQYVEAIHTGDIFTDGIVRIHVENMVDDWLKEQSKEE